MKYDQVYIPLTADEFLVLFKTGIVKRSVEITRNGWIQEATPARGGYWLIVATPDDEEGKQTEVLIFCMKSKSYTGPHKFLIANTNSEYNVLLSTADVEALNEITEL